MAEISHKLSQKSEFHSSISDPLSLKNLMSRILVEEGDMPYKQLLRKAVRLQKQLMNEAQ